MSRAPTIPGMSDFPELEKKYQRSYQAAKAKASRGGCASCDVSSVVRSFQLKLAQRRERDN